jgi:hypothetical protein
MEKNDFIWLLAYVAFRTKKKDEGLSGKAHAVRMGICSKDAGLDDPVLVAIDKIVDCLPEEKLLWHMMPELERAWEHFDKKQKAN